MPVIPYPKAVGSVAGLLCLHMLIGRQRFSHNRVWRFESACKYQKEAIMTEPISYEVECQECDARWQANKTQIRVYLDEMCDYSDTGYITDCWWIHDYYAECPTCQSEVMIDILSPHSCCLDSW